MRRVAGRDLGRFSLGTAVAGAAGMRTLLAVVAVALVLAACTRSNGLFIAGDGGGGGGVDGASSTDFGDGTVDLRREKDGGGPPLDLSQPPTDLSGGPICVSTCNHCTSGACCPGGKNGCCNPGEYCDAAGQCRCGSGPACTGNLMCASGGPIMPGGPGQCGAVCCGDITHPCPL